MAYVGQANVSITAGGAADAFNSIKQALCGVGGAGWELMASGSPGGTNPGYSATGTPDRVPDLTSWNQAGAWCRIREPGGVGGREYVFMRGSTAAAGIIKYSRATGFVGGSPGTTTLPTTGSNGDGVVWLGTSSGYSATQGAGASPSNTYDIAVTTTAQAVTAFTAAGNIATVASNAAVNGVYAWYMLTYSIGTGLPTSIFYTEAVQAGTYPTQDTDPSYRNIGNPGSIWVANNGTSREYVFYWQAYALSGYRLIVDGAFALATQVAQDGVTYARGFPAITIGFGAYGATVQTYPVLISSPTAWPKGFSTGIGCINVTQNNMDTLNLTGAEPRVVIAATGAVSAWVMPWIPNVVPTY